CAALLNPYTDYW
nr:immunoglobulin heavy chain junction region [Macaca mulatta]